MKKKIEGKTFNSFVMLFLLLNKYSFVLLDIFLADGKGIALLDQFICKINNGA